MAEPAEARPLSILRIALWAATAFAAVLVLAFALEALTALLVAAQRGALPFADVQYSEAPLFVQLLRLATGRPAYLSTLAVNSYVFGPVYLYVLAAWNAIAHAVDLPSDRFLTMAIGLCGVPPLVFCALTIARRAAARASPQIAAAVAATLALAVLPRTMTFEALHPDDLLFTLVAVMLALYNAAAGSRRGGAFALALAATGALACFTEAHAAALAPVFLLGMAVVRTISLRALINALTGYAVTLLGGMLAIGSDARAWTLLVPVAQPWDVSPARLGEAFALLTQWHPYIGLLLAAAAAACAFVWLRQGPRTIATDVLPLAAIVGTAIAGYLVRGGLKNALFLIGVAGVPYLAAAIAAAATPRVLALRNRATVALAAATVLLAGGAAWTLNVAPKEEPSELVYSTLEGAKSTAAALCARGQGIVAMALPDLFADCPNATFALGASFQQLVDAFPGYYVGQTVFDREQRSPFVVTLASVQLPPAWAADYRIERTVPAFFGYDALFFSATLQVYRHR